MREYKKYYSYNVNPVSFSTWLENRNKNSQTTQSNNSIQE